VCACGREAVNAALRFTALWLDEYILHAWRHVSTSIKLTLVIQPAVESNLVSPSVCPYTTWERHVVSSLLWSTVMWAMQC